MLEFRHLSHLLVACEHENLTQAADELHIAPSTLSASLKALETEFDLVLLKRLGGGLYPRSSARWLFRAALTMLLLESHTRRRLAAPDEPEPSILTVDVRPLFTIGRITKAVLRAITATATEEPAVLIHPVWPDEEPTPFDDAWMGRLGFHDAGCVTLDMVGPHVAPASCEIELLVDPWVLAYRCPTSRGQDPAASAAWSERTIITPAALPRPFAEFIEQRLREHKVRSVKALQYHPGALPRLLSEQPDAAFLLPGSALAGRLGLLNVRSTPLEPAFNSRLVARLNQPSAVADRFIGRLKEAFDGANAATLFNPELTARRIRYFNLTHRVRSVSAAARVANVAQPALGEQLRKLELTLGGRLFERHSDGVSPSRLGDRFAPVSLMLEEGLRALKTSGVSSTARNAGRLSLGVLPSVSQHSPLVSRIADTLCAIRSAFPKLEVSVHEAPNGTLQDWVTRGVVGLAIVETGPPQIPRLPLGSSEPLALIANARHDILPPGPVRLSDLANLRLALPSSLSGLRQLLEAAAQAERVKLRPAMQIDALPMLIALLQREAICTVLPSSAVRKELSTGELCAHTIVEPQIFRRMFVIHSGDRGLTEPERAFISLLRDKLAADPALEIAEPLAGLAATRADLQSQMAF